jgi:formate-dependent nitrite reductase cytochrome c552 subunit
VSKTLVAVIVVAVVFAGAFGDAVFREPSAVVREQAIQTRPIQHPADGYASSDGCQACHPSQFASWRASYHRTMTGVATPESVAADFDGVTVTQVPGHPMRLERRGRELWAELDEPDWDGTGDAPPRITRQVVMTTGSHHQQIYWYATGHGRLLGQLPAIRLVADDRWIPRRSAVMHPPNIPLVSESGSWNAVCVSCHTTLGKTALGTPWGEQPLFAQRIDTTATEFGIACESCHGPAADHIRANRNPARRYALHLAGSADQSIVQPLRLDARRSSEVCGQCHGLWEFYDAAAERAANDSGLPYRPGDELTKTRFIVQPSSNADSPTMKRLLAEDANFVRDIFWSDGMVRATGREYNGLIDSPCYRNAKDDQHRLTCFSCHSMHREPGDQRSDREWADDQLKPQARGNGACLECHAAIGERLTAHTHHQQESSGSSCYNCHMPHTTYGLLKTIRSHQISNPSVQASLDTGRPNACNLCHLDKTHQWTAEYLERWYKTPQPASMSDDDRTIAAALVSMLKGDAGQRAIIAQAFGATAAHQASGTAWMAPYLSLLLNDSYDAVRYIAARSLRTLPGYETFVFDFVANDTDRAANQRRALGLWRDMRNRDGRPADATLLFNRDGSFIADRIDRLTNQRNNRRVFYRE